MRTPWLAAGMGSVLSSFLSGLLLLPILLSTPKAMAAEQIMLVEPHGETVFFNLDKGAEYFNKGNFTEQFFASGLTFNITYEDVNIGFDDPDSGAAVRRRFEEVLAYVANVINFSNGTLDILVRASETDGRGALATAGTFYPVSPGIHRGSTLDRLMNGTKPFGGFPEISVQVDVGFAWNVSAGNPAGNEADFFSVLLHEVTHGLGFTSLVEPDGSSAVAPGVYSIFDSWLREGQNGVFLIRDGAPPVFQVSTTSLVSDDVWFAGPQAVVQYGQGTPVPIYAPNPYEDGSSTSHWDVDALVGDGVMTHIITLGTQQREYAPVELGTLVDLGFVGVGSEPVDASLGCYGLSKVEGTSSWSDAAVIGVALFLLWIAASGRRLQTLKYSHERN